MSADTRIVTIRWSNTGMVGDETLEVWRKDHDGAWELVEAVPVEPTPTQEYALEGLDAGDDHSFQIRPGRAGVYAAGYEGGDPDAWPAASLLEYTTDLPVPVVAAVTWERTSAIAEELRFTLTDPPVDAGTDYVVQRQNGLAWDDLPTTTDRVTGKATIAATAWGETNQTFRVRFETSEKTGTPSGGAVQWVGPPPPSAVVIAQDVGHLGFYDVTYGNSPYAGAGAKTHEVQVTDNGGGWTVLALDAASPANINAGCPTDQGAISARVRTKTTQFAVTDFSEYEVSGNDVAPNC